MIYCWSVNLQQITHSSVKFHSSKPGKKLMHSFSWLRSWSYCYKYWSQCWKSIAKSKFAQKVTLCIIQIHGIWYRCKVFSSSIIPKNFKILNLGRNSRLGEDSPVVMNIWKRHFCFNMYYHLRPAENHHLFPFFISKWMRAQR